MQEDVRRDPSLAPEFERFRENFLRLHPNIGWTMDVVRREDELPWVRFDLRKLLEEVRARGLPLVLQTYPPKRYSEDEWLANIAIREFSTETGVFISDTDQALRHYFREHGEKDGLYSFFQGSLDDHLNDRGYGLVAEILRDTLLEHKLVP